MRPLKFGMLMFPIHNPAHDPTLQLAQDIQLAEHADQLGFDEFWFGEHHSGGWQIIADPLLMVARASATTTRIKLGSGVSTLAYHHPKLLLDSVIQLDHLTRGRFMFGVGAGALALDSLMMGLDPMKARGAMEESLEAMMLLLQGDGPVTYTPEHADWRLVDAYLQLQPYSDELDIRVAVFNSASGPRLAGRWGLGMVSFGAAAAVGLGKENRMALALEKAQYKADEYGRTLDRRRWSAMSPMHIAPTEAQARQEVRFGISQYIDYIRQILPMNVPVDSDVDNIIDTLHLAGHGVIGTPEMAVRHIERIQELSGGIGTFLIEHADWANVEHSRASMELFAREVAPHFSGRARARQEAYSRELQHDQLTRRTMAKAQAAADLGHSREVKARRQAAAHAAQKVAAATPEPERVMPQMEDDWPQTLAGLA
ncbi:LLM class flavin-dependent oxidoreductase [Deinococcus sp.]|uniref:LLM class flavin-dependent oxidoreductase n=1 Tax=Deinococcus sp. TaxID=47478 RepID=UPI003B5B7DB8